MRIFMPCGHKFYIVCAIMKLRDKDVKSYSASEKLLIEEIVSAAQKVKIAIRGFTIGALIKFIRFQLGMSQKALAKRAGIPQSTVSRVEQSRRDVSLSTLNKILSAISCDVVIVPLLQDSINATRRKQARKIAEKQVGYLKGTMNLEEQQPDSRFIEELIKQEEDHLLQGSNTKLWEE
jgi:transcriptional regulator with XRE-family HTH domain